MKIDFKGKFEEAKKIDYKAKLEEAKKIDYKAKSLEVKDKFMGFINSTMSKKAEPESVPEETVEVDMEQEEPNKEEE